MSAENSSVRFRDLRRSLAALGTFVTASTLALLSTPQESAYAVLSNTSTPIGTPTPDNRPCTPLPTRALPIYSYLSERPGFCLITSEMSTTNITHYDLSRNAIVVGRGVDLSDEGRMNWIIMWESCNGHHDRVAEDAGLRLISPPQGWWYGSPEGIDYLQVTGWRWSNNEGYIEPTPEPGWPWLEIIFEPSEDATAVCINWINSYVGLLPDSFSKQNLQNYPIRYAWAQRWLPAGTLTPTANASVATYTITPTATRPSTSTETITPTATRTPTPTESATVTTIAKPDPRRRINRYLDDSLCRDNALIARMLERCPIPT